MIFKAMFLRPLAVLLAACLMLISGGAFLSGGEEYDVRDPETCALNFSVLSDTHLETNNLARAKVYIGALKNVKKNKSGNDAVVFLGDNTMNGQLLENLLFHGAAATLLKNETVLPVMGNHDIGNGEGDYEKLQNRWYTFTGAFFGRELEHPYYYEVIDGFYFIVLGQEGQTVYEMPMTDAQFMWLEGVLDEAAGSGKPVFVFSHYPADDAADENGNYTDRLIDLLASYNEEHDLFCFVGHTHMPMLLFWSFHTYDGFPETYLPRMTSLSGDTEITEDSGIGVEVEVYENEVLIRARNFYSGEWAIDDLDDVPLEVTYPLKNPLPQTNG